MPKSKKKQKEKAKSIDYDALFKEFITEFFPDFIAFVNPALYEAIDWEKGFVFLEQELINALRGKFKVRGKRRHTDKLVKVHLKEGNEHVVFVHGEFQHKIELGFALRMYTYRTLIGLRYNVEDITAIAVFTGAAPPLEERSYFRASFGTKISYDFVSIVAVEYDEQALIQAADNPFAVAILAAQYTYRSRKSPKLRMNLKIKLFELINSRNLDIEKLVRLLIFVKEFVDLPIELEHEFQETQFSLDFPNSINMTISQSTKDFAVGLYERVFGYNPVEALKEEKKKSREERQAAIEAQKREEEERLRLDQVILNLYEMEKFTIAEIAGLAMKSEEYVQELIVAANLGKE
jgi:hypothetical protein